MSNYHGNNMNSMNNMNNINGNGIYHELSTIDEMTGYDTGIVDGSAAASMMGQYAYAMNPINSMNSMTPMSHVSAISQFPVSQIPMPPMPPAMPPRMTNMGPPASESPNLGGSMNRGNKSRDNTVDINMSDEMSFNSLLQLPSLTDNNSNDSNHNSWINNENSMNGTDPNNSSPLTHVNDNGNPFGRK